MACDTSLAEYKFRRILVWSRIHDGCRPISIFAAVVVVYSILGWLSWRALGSWSVFRICIVPGLLPSSFGRYHTIAAESVRGATIIVHVDRQLSIFVVVILVRRLHIVSTNRSQLVQSNNDPVVA